MYNYSLTNLNCSLSPISCSVHPYRHSLSLLPPLPQSNLELSPFLPLTLLLPHFISYSDSISVCCSLSSFLLWGRDKQSHSFRSATWHSLPNYKQSLSSLLRPLIPEPKYSEPTKLLHILGDPPDEFHGRIPGAFRHRSFGSGIVLLLQSSDITLKTSCKDAPTLLS